MNEELQERLSGTKMKFDLTHVEIDDTYYVNNLVLEEAL